MIERPGINDSDIAIIGMDGRFPKAQNVDQFWRNLVEGRDCVTFFSDEELAAAGVGESDLRRAGYVKANHVLQDIEMFDAGFFSIPRKEAEIIDPQQRLLLESAHAALEDAGHVPQTYRGVVGVYVGVGMNTYLLHNLHQRYRNASSVDHYQLMLANDKDFLPTRVSYKLNLRGPSVCINTACSTALVAVHIACLSLLSGECDMALAGGASIRVPQVAGYQFQDGMIFSPDGHCRAFDNAATGTILGNGLGVVVLKRLADALKDRDHIYALIKGSAINNDGSLKAGYTAPSIEGQAAVVADAMAIAGIDARSVSYVEAHGTATPLGDPVEVAALTLAHRKQSDDRQYCALGSVKTNVGHLDTAAGMAGLIKTVLMLKHRTLVPSLHFHEANSSIDFTNSPFFVQTKTTPWHPAEGAPRRAGVSAFGIGGTNAHVVLQEAPGLQLDRPSSRAEVVVISAKSDTQLDQATANLARHLRQHPQIPLSDVAYTLSAGRQRHSHRRVVVATDTHDAALSLALADHEKVTTRVTSLTGGQVTFLVSDRWQGDAAALLDWGDLQESEPVFRRHFAQCAASLSARSSVDLQRWRGRSKAAGITLRQDESLALSFAISYASARLFMAAGIMPGCIVGCGVGSFVAACLAGVFHLEDALDVIARQGEMRRQDLQELIATKTLSLAHIPLFSASSGARLTDAQARDPKYWAAQLSDVGDYSLAARCALDHGQTVLLEVSPGCSLARAAVQASSCEAGKIVAGSPESPQERVYLEADERLILSSLGGVSHRGALNAFLDTIGALWLHGVDVDWDGYFDERAANRVSLPTYPFQRKRFWVDPEGSEGTRAEADPRSELVREISRASEPNAVRILSSYLQREIAGILGLEAPELPDAQRSFMELKLESLTLIEIVAKLSVELGLAIPSSSLVEYPTIASFAKAVIDRLTAASGMQPKVDVETAAGDDLRRVAMQEQRRRRRSTRMSDVEV